MGSEGKEEGVLKAVVYRRLILGLEKTLHDNKNLRHFSGKQVSVLYG